jgi:hypothetical protein
LSTPWCPKAALFVGIACIVCLVDNSTTIDSQGIDWRLRKQASEAIRASQILNAEAVPHK